MLKIVQRSYKTHFIEAAQTIVELIDRVDTVEALNLAKDEIAFYDVQEIYYYLYSHNAHILSHSSSMSTH